MLPHCLNGEDDNEASSDFESDKHFIIKGPPSTVRLGFDGITNSSSRRNVQPLQPRPYSSQSIFNDNNNNEDESMFTPFASKPSSNLLDDDENGIPPALSRDGVGQNTGIDLIPSIYTLRHPLDEIHPCRILPMEMDHFGNDGDVCADMDTEETGDNYKVKKEGSTIWRKKNLATQETRTTTTTAQPILHFANVYEKVIFVGKPRSFLPVTKMSKSTQKNGDEKGSLIYEEDNDAFVVTYNMQWKRHTIWILRDAPPPPSVQPLWKQMSQSVLRKSQQWRGRDADGRSSTLEFSDLHADLSLTCLYSTVDVSPSASSSSMVGSGATLDYFSSPKKGSELPARNVFLSTTINGSGDFVLCLLQSLREDDSRKRVTINKTRSSSVLRCFTLEPSWSNYNSSEVRSSLVRKWTVSNTASIPCLSAQPVHSTPIDPPTFLLNLAGEQQRSKVTCEWHRKKVLNPPLAIDILLCRADKSENARLSNATKLSLFRSSSHIVDCAVPSSLSSSEASATNDLSVVFASNTMRVVGLRYSVGDRVDFICENSDKFSQSNHQTKESKEIVVRAALSLVMKGSPITESALLAIGSALSEIAAVKKSDYKSSTGDDAIAFLDSENAMNDVQRLAFQLRSDCARYVQLMSLSSQARSLVDDVEWSAFSSLITSFFDIALSSSSLDEVFHNFTSTDRKGNSTTFDEDNDDDDDDAAWEDMLKSDFHRLYQSENKEAIFLGSEGKEEKEEEVISNDTASNTYLKQLLVDLTPSSLSWLASREDIEIGAKEQSNLNYLCCRKVFDALHLLYEDIKLTTLSRQTTWTNQMGNILLDICVRVSRVENNDGSGPKTLLMSDFIDYYLRDQGNNSRSEVKEKDSCMGITFSRLERITTFDSPPCFLSLIELMIGCAWDEVHAQLSFRLNGVCATMRTVSRFFRIMHYHQPGLPQGDKTSSHWRNNDRKLVMEMVEGGIMNASDLLHTFIPGISVPLLEIIHRCRSDPPPPFSENWSSMAYNLIGRSDLGQIQLSLENTNNGGTESSARDSEIVNRFLDSDDSENDGLNSLERFCCMMFPNDNRVRETARLLRSSRPTFLRLDRSVEISDHDFERVKQERLSLLSLRTLALPLGRGMMTTGTLEPIPAEQLAMPSICLSGRVPPQNATLAFDMTNCAPDMKVWPEFHNGVAAGLRLPRSGKLELTRTWIIYNKPAPYSSQSEQNDANTGQDNSPTTQPNHAHGGFLMAMGLLGHLSSLYMTDVCDYLTQGPVTTKVGILLGMAANRRGTCDLSVSKMLCLHIPSLLPPSFASIDFACSTQTAAVAGIGILHQGSSHRLMTEFLLNEMGKRPTNELDTNDREGYTLCCGLALGMVNLSHGERSKGTYREGSAGLSDLNIEERLNRYIIGGPDNKFMKKHGDESERSGEGNNTAGGDHEICSKIYEGDNINVDITAPGATLALGMIYLRSGNKTIASQVSLPDTHFLLDYVRPDFLFLRVVSRALILWDEVEPSESWINNQIPSIVAQSYAQFRVLAEKASGLAGLATFANMTMAEDSKGEVVEGNGKNKVKQDNGEVINQEEKDEKINTVHKQAIRQAYIYIVSGACFSLGLRYAGTGNSKASEIIHTRILELQKLRDGNDPISLSLRPEQPIIEMCLGSTAVALAMVMAGTGDLETLRLLKVLRWKCDDSVMYGNHMAYAAAIGLLFLGGGSCTLGREPADIAALLIAFFPRFSAETSDNQYHLQALRHLYVLALRNRKIEAIDIDSKERVFIPMQVQYSDRSSVDIKTPCLLLDKGKMLKVHIVSERYYPVEVDLEPFLKTDTNISLYVKKKSGHLTYMQDPYALRPPLIQSGGCINGAVLESIKCITEDSSLQIFAEFFCITPAQNNLIETRKAQSSTSAPQISMEEFCLETLYESLTKEKLDVISLHLTLFDSVLAIEKKSWPVKIIWDLRLLRSFYTSKQKYPDSGAFELLSPKFIGILCESVDRLFARLKFGSTTLSSYATTDLSLSSKVDDKWLGSFLIWHSVPAQNSSISAIEA